LPDIWLLGGRDQLRTETNSIQSFKINEMQTNELSCMPMPLIGFATAFITGSKGAFVVAGGISSNMH